MNYFITGTDTGVGKTYFTAMLTRGLRAGGTDAVAMKPICCGDNDDAVRLREAGGGLLPIEQVNPVWLRTPASPLTASQIENRVIAVDRILEIFTHLRKAHRCLLVEGVGGWLTPLRVQYSMADLASEMGLSVLVVIRNRLGALNHTLLTVESIQRRGLRCAGLVLNNIEAREQVDAAANRATLERICDIPVIYEIARGQTELDVKALH